MAKRHAEVKEVKEPSLQGKIKSDFPKHTLQEALRVPQALEDANGAQPLPPIETAGALDMSPGSSGVPSHPVVLDQIRPHQRQFQF